MKLLEKILLASDFSEEKDYVSPVPAQYALEMNQGWFERNSVRVGDRVEF